MIVKTETRIQKEIQRHNYDIRSHNYDKQVEIDQKVETEIISKKSKLTSNIATIT